MKTKILVASIILIIAGFGIWIGAKLALNTSSPSTSFGSNLLEEKYPERARFMAAITSVLAGDKRTHQGSTRNHSGLSVNHVNPSNTHLVLSGVHLSSSSNIRHNILTRWHTRTTVKTKSVKHDRETNTTVETRDDGQKLTATHDGETLTRTHNAQSQTITHDLYDSEIRIHEATTDFREPEVARHIPNTRLHLEETTAHEYPTTIIDFEWPPTPTHQRDTRVHLEPSIFLTPEPPSSDPAKPQ